MIHERKITLRGPEDWVKRTLANSLPEGINAGVFGEDRSITVETLLGDPVRHDMPGNKPEARFEVGKIHFLVFDDGLGSFKIEKASFDGQKINQMVDAYNGEGGAGGPYFAASIDLE